MDSVYKQLFTEIAHAVEVTAEQVLELDIKKNDTNGQNAARVMREDYSKLYDRLRSDSFKEEQLERADYAKLLVGAFIVAKNLEQRIEQEKKALEGWKLDTIPKLDRIVNETKTTEEAQNLAKEIFKVKV